MIQYGEGEIMITTLILVLFAYLYGSIPFSLLVGFAYGIDIRTTGSGNVGGTNLGRTCGKKAFIYGFICDFSKGAIAVIVANIFGVNPILLAFFAILGHTFPIFLKFKGGKGVATAFGFVCAYSFWGAMFAILVFIFVLKISKYVSLSSLIAIAAYLLYAIIFHPLTYALLVFIIFLFVCYMHKANIKKIINGSENKITWM